MEPCLMAAKTKLELTWIGKDNRPRLEPRILIEDANYSHHSAKKRVGDVFDNILVRGDNLLALKALENQYIGTVQCVYFDPPYNTGSAFEFYEDGIEHSLWLTLIRERLSIAYELLASDGSLWVSIDDNEAAYLRVVLDEIFGRSNFVATIIWEKRTSRENRRAFSFRHDYVFVYAKNKSSFEGRMNQLPLTDEVRARYKNPDNDPRGAWQSISANAQAGHGTASQFYTVTSPSGRQHNPPPGTCWRYSKARMDAEIAAGNIYFGKDGSGVPRIKKFLDQSTDAGLTPETIWRADEVGTNDSAKKHLLALLKGVPVFDNPKPEGLLERIIQIATNPGELVLDSFAGSGTTGAVAHKMGRRWIMVELGDHCETHIVPRLKKVIEGQDPGGITEAVGWKGGGGYRYFKLAPSLLEKDRFDNWVISKAYNAEMLAEAMCKHFGFTYAPSKEHYWQHGSSSETDFIYVTTNSLTHDQLRTISEEVGPERTLLICCKAFQGANADEFGNLTIRKIPGAILDRCEWGKDDYSLKIEALPMLEDEPEVDAEATPSRKAASPSNQPGLFNGDEEGEA
jgi:adenine-specific DNA-methyltransferase